VLTTILAPALVAAVIDTTILTKTFVRLRFVMLESPAHTIVGHRALAAVGDTLIRGQKGNGHAAIIFIAFQKAGLHASTGPRLSFTAISTMRAWKAPTLEARVAVAMIVADLDVSPFWQRYPVMWPETDVTIV